MLSGGVGGARLARGFADSADHEVTVVVNTGDDDWAYGVFVTPDLDTVLYTAAGIEGPQGWGRAGDSFGVMGHLADLGVNTAFAIGDADLAVNLFRTDALRRGIPLSEVTRNLADRLGVTMRVLPMTDQPVRTKVKTTDGTWRSFREYFVDRGHRDGVADVRFEGALEAAPAPGVVEAISASELLVIAPSNPPLSIWPILAVPGVAGAVAGARRVVAVSPLFGGEALKGPAHTVMAGLGLPAGNAGVVAAYEGLLNDLVVDTGDGADRGRLTSGGLTVHVRDTLLATREQSAAFCGWLVDMVGT